jgi:hypothetical protein
LHLPRRCQPRRAVLCRPEWAAVVPKRGVRGRAGQRQPPAVPRGLWVAPHGQCLREGDELSGLCGLSVGLQHVHNRRPLGLRTLLHPLHWRRLQCGVSARTAVLPRHRVRHRLCSLACSVTAAAALRFIEIIRKWCQSSPQDMQQEKPATWLWLNGCPPWRTRASQSSPAFPLWWNLRCDDCALEASVWTGRVTGLLRHSPGPTDAPAPSHRPAGDWHAGARPASRPLPVGRSSSPGGCKGLGLR